MEKGWTGRDKQRAGRGGTSGDRIVREFGSGRAASEVELDGTSDTW